MDKINKYQTGIILLAVITGLILGHNYIVAAYSSYFIVPLLMLMLFGLFLSIDLRELSSSFLNIKFSFTNVLVNFIWTPVFAYLLGHVFLAGQLPIWIGFVMLIVTPCTDWYLVFTGMARGNLSLSTSILPVNLILQVLLLPIYLMLFFGQSGNIELSSLLQSILMVLLIPFAVAWIINKTTSIKNNCGQRIIRFFGNSQVIFLAFAVIAMFASEGKTLLDNPDIILQLLIPILIFFGVTFVLALFISKVLKFSYADKVSLVLTTMARNSPISLAIAVSAFPSELLIALSLVIGPLIELPVLLLTTQVLLKTHPYSS